MSPEQREFLNLETRPARLNAEQTGWLLGFHPHEVSILVQAGLLHPLGNGGPNSPRFFATLDLEECKDRKWLARATAVIQKHWRHQNQHKPSNARRLEAG